MGHAINNLLLGEQKLRSKNSPLDPKIVPSCWCANVLDRWYKHLVLGPRWVLTVNFYMTLLENKQTGRYANKPSSNNKEDYLHGFSYATDASFQAPKPSWIRMSIQYYHKLHKWHKYKRKAAQQEVILSLDVTDGRHFSIHVTAKNDDSENGSDSQRYSRRNSHTVDPKTAPRENHKCHRRSKDRRDEKFQTTLERENDCQTGKGACNFNCGC